MTIKTQPMSLSETWFMDGYIDFELQKYKLLAYLQEVNNCFNAGKLYPQLADVIFHYRNLVAFRKNKEVLQNSFPKEVSHVKLQKAELVYKAMLQDEGVMAELEQITGYSLQQLQPTIASGTEIYELVEQQLNIEPVGIMPLYKDEGYVLLRYRQQADVQVYSYTVSMLQLSNEQYRSVSLAYVDSYKKNISISYEHIKTQLVRSIRTLPNPAVYFIESPLEVPLNETLLPIAKRRLIRYIAAA